MKSTVGCKSPLQVMLLPLVCSLAFVRQEASNAAGEAGRRHEAKVPNPEHLSWLMLQTGIEPASPFAPLKPPSAEDKKRLEAIKRYCVGRHCFLKGRLLDAIAEYEKALELDPNSAAIYQSLIVLCQHAGQAAKYRKYLQQAVKMDVKDYRFAGQLARLLLREQLFTDAAEMYERALSSDRLEKKAADRVLFSYELSLVLRLLGRVQAAVPHMLLVLDALQKPDEYKLDSIRMKPPYLARPAEILERIGDALVEAKRYDDALRAYAAAQARLPAIGRARLLIRVAKAQIAKGEQEKALKSLEQYLAEQKPQGSEAYELLADVLHKLGRNNEILPRIERAANEEKFNLALQYFLGSLYEKAGRLAEAQKIYERVFEQEGDTRVYAALSRLYLKENKAEKILDVIGAAMDKSVRSRNAELDNTIDEWVDKIAEHKGIADELVNAALKAVDAKEPQLGKGKAWFAARVADKIDRPDESARLYRVAISKEAGTAPRLLLYMELGRMLERHDRTMAAIVTLREALAEPGADRFPHPYAELARLLLRQGKMEEALRAAQRASELAPGYPYGQIILAEVYSAAGNYKKAIDIYQQMLENFAGDKDVIRVVRYQLSDLYGKAGDWEKAEKELLIVLEQDPDDATANNNLGYLWAEQGKNLNRALQLIKKALEEEPKNPAFLDSMGWVLFKLGRPEEAIKYLEDATRQEGGQDGVIYDHLGDAYYRLGRIEDAKKAWTKALELLEKEKGARREEDRIREVKEKVAGIGVTRKVKGELKPPSKAAP